MSTKLTSIDFQKELAKLTFINQGGPAGADGDDGREVLLQATATHIQWQYSGDVAWNNLVALAALEGDAGVSPTVTLGDVTTGDAGTDVIITDSGVAPNVILNFTIPRGDTGVAGSNGTNGTNGTNGAAGTNGLSITVANYDPTTEGVDGDSWINFTDYSLWVKSAGSWGIEGNIKGDTGAAGADGIDGDQLTNGAVDPTDDTNNTFDEYYLQTTTNRVWVKYENTTVWVDLFGLQGDKYMSTSTDTINLSAYTVGDTVSLVVNSGLSYSIGQFVVVANSTTDYFVGKVLLYDIVDLDVEMMYKVGSGEFSAWTVNLAGIAEAQSNPRYYYIELPNAATLSQRCDAIAVQPVGWTIDSGDQLSNPLSANSIDLIVYHNLGKEVVDVVVKSITADKQVRLIGPVAYATFEDDDTKTYLCIKSFSETATSLGIFIIFED